jgi:hypothetical protein
MHQLPPSLQLHNLELERFCVQLQPGNGFRGVLGAAAATAGAPPLKQLRLSWCRLLGGDSPSDSLAAGLRQLPVLEHISLYYIIEVRIFHSADVGAGFHSHECWRLSDMILIAVISPLFLRSHVLTITEWLA